MSAYYNEHDPYAAQWLRNLIYAGHIAGGDVDERDIRDITELKGYTQCHLFAGIGGWSYALRLAGWPDERPIWTGSCPCQPFSQAGQRKGTADERHLWPEMLRLLASEQGPTTIFGEQVASKDGREWLAGVRADLEELGYEVGCADLCAASAGAPHTRQRLWWVANTGSQVLPRSEQKRKSIRRVTRSTPTEYGNNGIFEGLHNSPSTCPTSWVDGLPRPVGIVRAYGNAIVPQVAAEFVKTFMECRP